MDHHIRHDELAESLEAPDPKVSQLMAELERVFPDPVDVFEDELAARIGIHRHPNCPRQAWRRHRVAAIEAAFPDEE